VSTIQILKHDPAALTGRAKAARKIALVASAMQPVYVSERSSAPTFVGWLLKVVREGKPTRLYFEDVRRGTFRRIARP